MGACLCKAHSSEPQQSVAEKRDRPTHVDIPESTIAKASTASDVTPKKRSDSFRSKSLVGRVFGHESDGKGSRSSKHGSRAKLSRESNSPDQKLQGMTSMELVEQYSIDASILIGSAERIDRVRSNAIPVSDAGCTY